MSQATLRPDATVAQSGIAVAGGATAATVHLNLDDSPATDSSRFGSAGSSPAWVRLGFPNVTFPTGARVRSMTPRVRAAAQSTLWGRLVGELRKSTGQVLGAFEWNRVGSSYATLTAPSFAPDLTSGELDACEMYLLVNKSQYGGLYPVLVSEVYLDVVLAEVPTAAITTVTTSYTVSTVTVDWSHTPGADGGEQSHWQVVYLTAAQAATITGGDPLTSTVGIMFDSGVTTGGASTVTVPDVLAGVNHKRYVRTAQLVNGQPHWSAWTNQTFTVTLTTAEVLSVSPVVDDPNGRVRVTVARDTGHDPWTGVDVARSIDAGATWQTVAANATATGNSVIVDDWEPPLNVATRYRARALKAGPVAGSWVQSPGTVMWSPAKAWLKVPGNPALNFMPFTFDEPPAATRTREFTVTRLLDDGSTQARTVVAAGALGPRETELVIWTESLPEAAQLRAIVEHGECLLQPPASWRFGAGRFALGDMIEDVQDIDAGYFLQLWRVPAVELQ